MKNFALILICIFSLGISENFAQVQNPDPQMWQPNQSDAAIGKISMEITKISKSLEELNLKLQKFTETFSSNQGLKLTERQQKILAAFEFLNRAEQRLLTLQKLRLELSEKQISFKAKLAEIEDALRSESIDRSIVFRGTTDAEELRENRRRNLSSQRNELNQVLSEIYNSLSQTNIEIRETELFLDNIRKRIFPAVENEISDL